MEFAAFNAAPAAEAEALLTGCAAVASWAAVVAAGRPYPDRDELLAAAGELAGAWTVGDLEEALAGHPRIGERGPEQAQREQAGVGPGLATLLVAGNAAYEAKFGRVFLIRAAGRSGEEILEALKLRLDNDPVEEVAEAAAQLREITLLRLAEAVT